MKFCRPICRAAVWMFSLASAVSETFGLTSTPIVASFGTSSPRNCRHFESSALVDITTPVTLRLGRLRLAITPVFIAAQENDWNGCGGGRGPLPPRGGPRGRGYGAAA